MGRKEDEVKPDGPGMSQVSQNSPKAQLRSWASLSFERTAWELLLSRGAG